MRVTRDTAIFREPLQLESGRVLEGFHIAYETYGDKSNAKDRAVLICHGLTADAHVATGKPGPSKGWWEASVGPGKPFDTNRYFVICSNVLGGCGGSTGPSSIDPHRGSPYGLRFPVITIRDMVRAQERLANSLEIGTFHTIVGGCFGGFQVLEWMRTFPSRLRNAIIISATPRTTTHNLGLWEVLRRAITSDPNFNGGDYYGKALPASGMALAQMFGIMVWMDRAVMARRFGLRLRDGKNPSYTLEPEFEFQLFLSEVGQRAVGRFDPNSLIYLTKAMDYFDISRDCPDLSAALVDAEYRTLLIAYRQDWRYPPHEMKEIQEALTDLGVSCEMHVCDSSFGHGAFLYDSVETLELIGKFMASA